MASLQNRLPRALWLSLVLVVPALGTTPALAGADDEAKPDSKAVQSRDEPVSLPKIGEIPLPEAEDLLRAQPFDWINLKTQELLAVDAISLRPDIIGQVQIRHDMAQQLYNRVLKHKPYKDAELASLRQFHKGADSAKEFDAREAQLKQDLENNRERVETSKPATYKIQITLRDRSIDPDYILELRFVDSVTYYEDLVLRRADQLIEEGRTPLAYDLLMLVVRRHRENNARIRAELESIEQSLVSSMAALDDERNSLRKSREELNAPRNRNTPAAKMRLTALEKTIVAIAGELKDLEDELKSVRFKLRFVRPKDYPNPDPPRKDDLLLPTWPKFDEVYQRLIFRDSDEQLKRGNPEEALRLLEEIGRTNATNNELSLRLGKAVDELIDRDVQAKDYRQARHFWGKLSSRDPSNPIIEKWRLVLVSQASAMILDARSAAAQGEADVAARTVDFASRIWPDTPGLKEAHRELTERYQTAKVGVIQQAPHSGPTSIADERQRWLTESKLFEPVGISDQGVRYRSNYFESWEPTDLGRRVQFRLKFKRADWEARTRLTASDLQAELALRTQASSPLYDERLAGYVNGISVQTPLDFTLYFRQLPLRLESLCQFTVAAGDATRSLNEETRLDRAESFGRLRFHQLSKSAGETRFGRVHAQPASSRQHRVDEIVEVEYQSWEHLLQGLLRGEISVVPVVDLRDLKGLQDDNRFSVFQYALPSTHLLMMNPVNRALQDGQLRRALLHGIPRERLLKEIFLRDVTASRARLITCPFATNSYGYNHQLPQPEFDPALAATLALTAKKQSGGSLASLRIKCGTDPREKEIVLAMIDAWRRIGIEVQLVSGDSTDDWDLCYRSVKSIEPLMDIWSLLTMHSSARVEDLQTLSEPTRRMLLELERTVDWNTATKLLHRLLADQLIEARYIPLWETDDFLVARKNINGIPARPMHPYDDVEKWTVSSWYPVETP